MSDCLSLGENVWIISFHICVFVIALFEVIRVIPGVQREIVAVVEEFFSQLIHLQFNGPLVIVVQMISHCLCQL